MRQGFNFLKGSVDNILVNNFAKIEEQIVENIDDPERLEKLYRANKPEFRRAFPGIADDHPTDLVRFWKIRLAPETGIKITGGLKLDLWVVVLLSLFSGILVKLPDMLTQINSEFFYARDLALIVFNGIILYTFRHNRIFDKKKILIYGSIMLVLALFINLLPDTESDSITLSLIFTPLFLWCVFGLSFTSFDYKNIFKRIEFIRFNGELLIMTGLLLIAGGLLTAVTIGLFSVIHMDIENFYMNNIAVFGGVAAPIVSFYLIRLYPNLTSKLAPVIARVFTPLVLLTLTVYLVSFIFSQSKILDDRDLLMLFNVMLIGVLAIIVFSVSELDKSKEKNRNVLILFLLAALAIVINAIALTAIISRIAGGLTPNRSVVLVSNILIFINLILIAKNLFVSYFRKNPLDTVEQTVARYLTIYAVWTVIVIFILPFVFGLK